MTRMSMMTVATGALLLAGGCRTSTLPPGAQRDPLPRENYPRVVVLDDLQRWVVVDAPIVTKSERDPLRVTVPVRAVTDHEELNVQYRFAFFDADGRPMDPEPSWRYERLPSKAQRMIEANALDQRAVDWRVDIRPAR